MTLRELCLPLHDIVCCLLVKPFSTWDEFDQIDIVRTGRPTPTCAVGKTKSDEDGKYHFFRNVWYFRYKFICGSPYTQNLYCWPCLLFGDESDRWVFDGTLSLDQEEFPLFDEHMVDEKHDACIKKLAEFKRQKYKKREYDDGDVGDSSHIIRLNRLCVMRALDAVLFMIKNQMPLDFEDEFNSCGHVDLFHMLMSQSPRDQLNHFRQMKGSVNPILATPMVQGLVESVSDCIQYQIEIEVEKAQFFSIRIDNGLYESSEAALYIRIVNVENQLKEFFIGYYSLGNDKTSLSLFRILDTLLGNYNYKQKLIGISFDITCIKFNYMKDLRVGLKFMAQLAVHVNLFGHSIDHLLEKCLCSIPACRQFFANLSALFNLTKILVKRNYCPNSEDWKEVCNLKKSCCSKFKLLSAMTNDWARLIVFFQGIQKETVDLDDVSCLVSSISEKLRDHQFVFLAVFFRHIFQITNGLYRELLDIPFDVKNSRNKVKDVCVILYKQRSDALYEQLCNQANSILVDCSEADDSLPLPVTHTCYKSLFYEIIDNIIMELHTRYEFTENNIFLELGDLRLYETNRPFKTFIRNRVKIVMKYYPSFFKKAAVLEDELFRCTTYRNFWKTSLLNVIVRVKSLQNAQLDSSEAFRLLKILTLLSPSSTETFPCLHDFSSYLKESDAALRPHLASILMNKEVLDALSVKYSFKDNVLDRLATKCDSLSLSTYIKKSKTTERQPETTNTKPQHVEPNTLLSPVETSDLTVQPDPLSFITPDMDPPDISEPGPSSRAEPDSSMMELDQAMTCEIYPAHDPPPDTLPKIKIKNEPVDPDLYRQDILSASVVLEMSSFSNESGKQDGSLFQPPALIKEEAVSSEEEL